MSLVTIPEHILLTTLQKAIEYVRTDYADAVDKDKSYLALLFKDSGIERYLMYDQAISVICTEPDNPRHFIMDIMFNHKKDNLPTAYIVLPSEMPSDGNAIGMGEDEEEAVFEDPEYRQVFTRRIQCSYNIVIISDNPNEVVLLYHLIRALIIACHFHLSANGIQNLTFNGQDLRIKEDTTQMFTRAVGVTFQYVTRVPAINTNVFQTDVNVEGTPVLDED